ncbi:ATP-binding protein [Bacillota bacterium LX-D]|nr:ATP-binding protein [Bacillota bacterium LX-D]
MKKSDSKWFLTKVKRALKDFQMIDPGDRIAVGLSGGKDSTSLLYILHILKNMVRMDFEIVPITLDMGWEADWSPLTEFCTQLGLPHRIKETNIGKIVFDIRQETNPCSLCAKLRRGALHNEALAQNCNKVALGHHLDDAIETFLLNLLYAGKMGSFPSKIYLDRTKLTLIRPMVYLPQKTIVSLVKRENLPVVNNLCPANGHTKRQEMRQLITLLQGKYPDIRDKFLSAFNNVEMENLWPNRRK